MAKTVLVFGSTGAMGRTVASTLLASPNKQFSVLAFTRDTNSEQAQALKELGGDRLELVQGNLSDAASIERAMHGVWGVFCNTDFWTAGGVEGEFQQGVCVLEAARAAGVQFFIYSSLDDCTQISQGKFPVPHFDAKAAVEHFIDRQRSHECQEQIEDGFYSKHVSVLVTGTYFENLFDYLCPEQSKLADGRDGVIFRISTGDSPCPMIALDDIAWFAFHMFSNPHVWGGRTLSIMGDQPSMREVASIFERVTGVPADCQALNLDEMRKTSGNALANKYLFAQEFGFPRDYDELRRIHPDLLTFEKWLIKSAWRGEPRQVQKRRKVVK